MTIAVVDPDEVVRTVVKDHITTRHLAAVAYASLGSLTRDPRPQGPTVVVMGPSEAPHLVVDKIGKLLASRPDHRAIMLVSDLSAETMRSAFRAGVDDVIALSAEHTELLGSVSRSVSLALGEDVADGSAAMDMVTPDSKGQVIAVVGAKGGTGKSVVAVNLAVTLAQHMPGQVVLVDANLQFGDAAVMLQLRPEQTITDAIVTDRLDAEVIDRVLLRHDPSGLLVLAAPTDPVSAERIGPAHLLAVLTALRERFAHVIVDTSPQVDESTLAVLEAADAVMMLTTPDVMSLKNARLSLQAMETLGVRRNNVMLVLNETNTRLGLTRSDVERAAGMKVHARLPNDPLVAECANRGEPVVLSTPSSKFALSLDNLVRTLSTAPASSIQSQGPGHPTPRPQPALR